MTDKIKGSPSLRRRRGDWRYVIHDGRKIVWPESRAKVEQTANGRARRLQQIHHYILVTSCPDIGTGLG
jgi:hypothetical protein